MPTIAVNPSQVHDRYFDLLGRSPYREKINNLLKNETLAIKDGSIIHMYIDAPDDEWFPQFELEKNKILENARTDSVSTIHFVVGDKKPRSQIDDNDLAIVTFSSTNRK